MCDEKPGGLNFWSVCASISVQNAEKCNYGILNELELEMYKFPRSVTDVYAHIPCSITIMCLSVRVLNGIWRGFLWTLERRSIVSSKTMRKWDETGKDQWVSLVSYGWTSLNSDCLNIIILCQNVKESEFSWRGRSRRDRIRSSFHCCSF